MKKFLVAILSVLYLASASGATVNLHYCMGELTDTKLSGEHNGKCGKCGMSKSKSGKGCCSDAHRFVKSEQGHHPSSFDMPSFSQDAFFIVHPFIYTVFSGNTLTLVPTVAASPPHFYPVPLFISYSNFRI